MNNTINNTLCNLQQELELNIVLATAYSDYSKSLHAFVLRKLSNCSTGEDLVQQAFLKTWLYLKRGGKIISMKAFLYRIVNNLIIDEYRKHKIVSLESLLEEGYQVVDYDTPPGHVLDKKSALALIDHLPPRYKKIMHMRYRDDLSLDEISKMTRKSKNNISVQLHRSTEKLKQLYNLSK